MSDETQNIFDKLTEHDWIQIEMASRGCVSGTSDEWPHLRRAIEKIARTPNIFHLPKSAAWLQGFCEGVMIQSGRSRS